MKYSFKDISTIKKGTLTRVLINKKSIRNRNKFNEIRVSFRGEKGRF